MLNRFEFNAKRHSRNIHFQFYTHENHAVILYYNDFILEKLEYIHNNPVTARIVDKPKDFIYSSARNYAGLEGLLDVVLLDIP